MKLIVGLGNPGRKYEGTRHNCGFMVVSELARRHATGAARRDFQAELTEALVGGERTLLSRPETFMNKSGDSVSRTMQFYKMEPSDLLVISDDFNLPLAKLRFRAKGSAGGQKGLADVIRALGTDEFSRLRVGIGQPPEHWDTVDFVLSKFTKQEQEEIDVAIALAADGAETWVKEGIARCMNERNRGNC